MESDEYLSLSGILHFAFCRRRWALIHIEQLWEENTLTFSGKLLHKNADDPAYVELRGNTLITRAVPVVSHRLKVYGVADVVEYHRNPNGISLVNRTGSWQPVPVEYKSGKKNMFHADEVQLCCQAMCLEEMLQTEILAGYLYYGKNRRRVEVVFDEELRERVVCLLDEMYALLQSGATPPATPGSYCVSCSLVHLCMPDMSVRRKSVESYLNTVLRS
ncbi:CRISPR-associated protein Cas4 [Methanocorpusculum vombati]|uniref:CRISPR-associated exonuclease Cas4 n=1 Tax=Methanocorpusculum vombati TaxID=3002864 RepID=A0ABT4IMW0_9EURY|nr:CRISPR-associated protein Cas4 [Methanocorpusculum vombati]MCZ0862455.1 CRISPR-associated protein Cas4 [Methanocorpusculum vombati]MCZ9320211.1 CRISPR-associated protein Cas4 [Methanocorpusculum sp.]MDE2521130.1 CRISPR-associated protein Cas4 [Methanocorpusculum sp.]MDE2548293.1 CRISPR-associated protein Cas4 [Methanocorpusculum sp.]